MMTVLVFLNNLIQVLDKCEKLRDMDANILPSFLRLQELTGLNNVCVFLLTDVVWEKFCSKEGFMEPLQIHFQQYTKGNVKQTIKAYKKS